MKRFVLGIAIVAIQLCSCVQGETSLDEVKELLEDSTMVVGKVDVKDMDFDVLMKALSDLKGNPPSFEEQSKVAKHVVDFFRERGVKSMYFTMSLRDIQTGPCVLVTYDGTLQDATMIQDMLAEVTRGSMYAVNKSAAKVVGDVLVFGHRDTVERVANTESGEEISEERLQQLDQALQSAGDVDARIAFAPSADSRIAIEQIAPPLPEPFSKYKAKDVLDGVQWAAAGLGTDGGPSMKLTVESKDEAAANKMSEMLSIASRVFADQMTRSLGEEHAKEIESVVKVISPKPNGKQLVTNITPEQVDSIQKMLLAPARATAQRSQMTYNLKMIALSMLNFESAYRAIPPHASYDKNGKPLLSWRVYVLPFLEENELYDKFHLDEPWNSEHNRKLIKDIPQVFKHPGGIVENGKTTLQVPYGESTIFHGKNGTKLRTITDGTSRTLLCVDVAPEEAVEWTKPDDWEVNFEKPFANVLGDRSEFAACRCDGSVLRIKKDAVDAKKLRAMLTKGGGEILDD